MISLKDKEHLGNLTNWGNYWGGCPFTWNFKYNRLESSICKFQITKKPDIGILKFATACAAFSVYFAYLWIRCAYAILYKRPIKEFQMCFLMLAIITLALLFLIIFILKHKDLVLCLNSGLNLADSF